jgi:AraC-like DNA-binding protein
MTSTISQIMWPPPAIADCVFCMIIRDTRGRVLDHAQRFNFWPASPFCCVTWVFAGDVHLIDQPDQMERPWTAARLPSLGFFGPRLGPSINWNAGETYAISIGFYPDAFAAMTGLDLSPFAERTVPAEEALPEPILEVCRNFFDTVRCEGVERGISVLNDKIEIMWDGARPGATGSTRWINDWIASLVLRATQTGSGRSPRQIARRVKSWTGVSERDLQGLGNTEQLFAKMQEAVQKGDVDWAALAVDSGFTDQSHMIRRLKQHTGFTPKRLHENAKNDEAFWKYRIIGQYVTKRRAQ